jgi:hypothetical protein
MTWRLLLALPALAALACTGTKIGDLTGDPLNPDTYRAHIVAIDAIIFEDSPLSEVRRDQLSDTLLALSDKLQPVATPLILKGHTKNLRTLASLVKRLRQGTRLDGSPLRQQWIGTRQGLFDDRAWFRWSSADPIEPAEASPAPPPVR